MRILSLNVISSGKILFRMTVAIGFALTYGHAAFGTCEKIDGTRLEQYVSELRWQDGQQSNVVVFTNHSLVRSFNNMLNQWTRGSEYLASLTHFLFQHEFQKQLAQHGISVTNIQVPYFKSVEIKISVPAEQQPLVHQALNNTIKNIGERTWDAAFGHDSTLNTLVSDIENPTGILSRSKKFKFLNEQHHLSALTPDEAHRLRQNLQKSYTRETFSESLTRGYGVGMGFQLTDAAFAARINSQRKGSSKNVTKFNYAQFASILQGAANQTEQLSWLFANRSDSEINEIFRTIRANLGKTEPALWTAGMKRLARLHPESPKLNEQTLLNKVQSALFRYQKTINMLDFMPAEWTAQDPDINKQFDNLQNPAGVLFFDRRGLGAQNLQEFQRQIPNIRSRIQKLQELIDTWTAMSPAQEPYRAQQERIESELEELDSLRRLILTPSNEALKSSQAEIHLAMRSLGLKDAEYVLFSAGDDMILKFSGTQKNWQSVYQAFAQNPRFADDHRTVFATSRLPIDLSLNSVRTSIANAADVSKNIERLELPYSVLTRLVDFKTSKVALYRVQESGELAPVPKHHQSAMRAMVPDWTLQFPQ